MAVKNQDNVLVDLFLENMAEADLLWHPSFAERCGVTLEELAAGLRAFQKKHNVSWVLISRFAADYEIWVCDVTRRFGANNIPPHTLGGWFDAIEGALQRIRNDPPLRKVWRFAEIVRDEVWKQAGRETANDNEGDAEQGDGVRRDHHLDSMMANATAVAKEGIGVVN